MRRLEKLGFDEVAAGRLREEAAQAEAAVRRCQERVDELSAGLSGKHQCKSIRSLRVGFDTACSKYGGSNAGLDLRYCDPEPGFQRSRVKGVVAKLVTVKDAAAATALEVAAGGKLYQVVVDSQATAKALLSRGQLRNRVTIIPIDKVPIQPLHYKPNAA